MERQWDSVGLIEEDLEDEEQARYRRTEAAGGAGCEEDQGAASLQECLRLLDEAFPVTRQQQEQLLGGSRAADLQQMEQHWQDLLELMEPQGSDVDMPTSLEQTPSSHPPGFVFQPEPLSQTQLPQAERERPLEDTHLQREELLPLVPSDQLDGHSVEPDSHDAPHPAALEAFSGGPLSPLGPDVSSFLLGEDDLDDLSGGLDDILEEAAILEEMSLLDLALEEEGYLDPELTQRTSQLSLDMEQSQGGRPGGEEEGRTVSTDVEDEADSDSGLSLDSSHSPASPSESEASSYSSTSSSSSSSSLLSNTPTTMELEVTIKQEPEDEEELGAVGGDCPRRDSKHFYAAGFYSDRKMLEGFPWLEQISHDHTYNQPWSSESASPKIPTRRFKPSPRHEKPYELPRHVWSRDERRARALKIPFSNELIVNLPVEDFNDLLARYALSEEQLALIRDIRRRGKNKVAAQNCRKRKMDTLVGLKSDVSSLKRRKARLLREKQEALRTLQELRQRLSRLYQDVGSSLDLSRYRLSFEGDGGVEVVRRQRKSGRKQRDKK